jgi:uncharacterized protein (TIGR03000 family)
MISRMRARHHGSSGGSSGGSHGSSGGSSGGSNGRSYGSHGSSGGSHGSSGGSHGSSGGSYGSHGSSGGSHGSHGSSGGYVVSHATHSYSTPVHSTAVHSGSYESPVIQSSYQPYTVGQSTIQSSTPSTIVRGATSSSSTVQVAKPAIETGAAMLTVAVPMEAKVTVNGHETTSGGLVRQFKSRGLKEGYVYTYVVEATYLVNGEETKESKSVKLRTGDNQRIEFTQPIAEATPAEPKVEDVVTVVKLRVPDSAQVTLAGNPTSGSGSVRTFRTKQLKSGQQWADYTIRVTALVNGQTVSKERTINVIAGSTNELTFDFDTSSVASR